MDTSRVEMTRLAYNRLMHTSIRHLTPSEYHFDALKYRTDGKLSYGDNPVEHDTVHFKTETQVTT